MGKSIMNLLGLSGISVDSVLESCVFSRDWGRKGRITENLC